MSEESLFVSQVAKIASCHYKTVLNYEKRGLVHAVRDYNNRRRFTLAEALKLKEILEVRRRV